MLEAYIHDCGIVFAHKRIALVPQTHRGVKKLIAYYKLTYLIFPRATEKVVYVCFK